MPFKNDLKRLQNYCDFTFEITCAKFIKIKFIQSWGYLILMSTFSINFIFRHSAAVSVSFDAFALVLNSIFLLSTLLHELQLPMVTVRRICVLEVYSINVFIWVCSWRFRKFLAFLNNDFALVIQSEKFMKRTIVFVHLLIESIHILFQQVFFSLQTEFHRLLCFVITYNLVMNDTISFFDYVEIRIRL